MVFYRLYRLYRHWGYGHMAALETAWKRLWRKDL